jgi:hypothetical protein
MRLVGQYTNASVPEIIFSDYKPLEGSTAMSFIPGQTLKLDERVKERVCHETWGMITPGR